MLVLVLAVPLLLQLLLVAYVSSHCYPCGIWKIHPALAIETIWGVNQCLEEMSLLLWLSILKEKEKKKLARKRASSSQLSLLSDTGGFAGGQPFSAQRHLSPCLLICRTQGTTSWNQPLTLETAVHKGFAEPRVTCSVSFLGGFHVPRPIGHGSINPVCHHPSLDHVARSCAHESVKIHMKVLFSLFGSFSARDKA